MVNKWFTEKERATATALMLIGGPIGVGISHLMTGYWFLDVNDDTERSEFLSTFKSLMVTQLIMAIIFWIVFMVSMKEKPDVPPNAVAEVQYEWLSAKQSLIILKANPNFLMLLVAYGLPAGSFLAVGSLMSNIFDPYNF